MPAEEDEGDVILAKEGDVLTTQQSQLDGTLHNYKGE